MSQEDDFAYGEGSVYTKRFVDVLLLQLKRSIHTTTVELVSRPQCYKSRATAVCTATAEAFHDRGSP